MLDLLDFFFHCQIFLQILQQLIPIDPGPTCAFDQKLSMRARLALQIFKQHLTHYLYKGKDT